MRTGAHTDPMYVQAHTLTLHEYGCTYVDVTQELGDRVYLYRPC